MAERLQEVEYKYAWTLLVRHENECQAYKKFSDEVLLLLLSVCCEGHVICI